MRFTYVRNTKKWTFIIHIMQKNIYSWRIKIEVATKFEMKVLQVIQ